MGSFAVHQAVQLEQQVERLTRDLAEVSAEVASLRNHNTGLLVIEAQKDAEIERLRAVLRGVAEYCSGDDRTLGAIERLATIRNTVDRELINVEQGVGK